MNYREINVDLSSQEELMTELFPHAKSVVWNGATPVVLQNKDQFSDGFTGFIFPEDLHSMARHAESPKKVLPHRRHISTVANLILQ